MRRRRRRRRRSEVGVFGHLRLGLAAVATIVVLGTVGFMLIDRISPLDALYRTVGLMTTSGGYEDTKTTSEKEFATVVVVVGIASLFYTLGAVAEYLIEGHFRRAIARHRMERNTERLAGHGIICGFGRVDRRIAREFAEAAQPFVVIDMLKANVSELDAVGYLYVHGDATQDATLLEAGVQRAQSLLAATDADTENIAITLSTRALAPDVWIVARANREESERKLMRAGANRVLSPYTLGGHRMAGLARQPHLMEFLDTAVASRELDLALTVIQVDAESPLIGMPLPARADAQPPGMRDSTVLAVRPAGQGPWLTASRRKGKVVAVGDWLVVLGPVDQRQSGPLSAPEDSMRQPRTEAALHPQPRQHTDEDADSQAASPTGPNGPGGPDGPDSGDDHVSPIYSSE